MNQSVPPLFKYLPPERVDVLEDERVAFTPATRFNDPFDLHPTIAPIQSRAYLRSAALKTEGQFPIPRGVMSRKQERDLRRSLRRTATAQMRSNPEPLAARLQAQMVEQLNAHGGVLCLTTVKDSLLMWAHYASSHRGFVIEFNVAAPGFKALGRPLPINYSKVRPSLNSTKKPLDIKPFFVKSEEWGYEKEFRVVREFRHCQPIFINGKTVHFAPLPKEVVRAVYMGVNIEEATVERIRANVKGTQIEVYQATLPRAQFGLDFRQIS